MPVVQGQAMQPQAQPTAAKPGLTDEQIDLIIDRIEARLAVRNGNASKNVSTPSVPQASQDVTAILLTKRGKDNKSCADCHTGPSSKGAFQIFGTAGNLNPNINWPKIWDETDKGRMPPEATSNTNAALSDQEVNIIRQKILSTGKK